MSRHQKANVYNDVQEEDFDLRPPRQNRDRRSMSVSSANHPRVQLGSGEYEADNMECLLEEIFDERSLGIRLLSDDLVRWWHDFEAQMVQRVQMSCQDWFGKEMDTQSARRMLASVIGSDNVITVKRASYVNTYRVSKENDRLTRMEFQDVPPRSYITPIVRFDGLYIAEHHFSCSLTLTAVLVGDVRAEKDESDDGTQDALSQFQLHREDDITDPLACHIDDMASVDSFDTRAHAEYMSSFDI